MGEVRDRLRRRRELVHGAVAGVTRGRRILCVIALAGSAAAAGCGHKAAADLTTYSSKQYGFSFQYRNDRFAPGTLATWSLIAEAHKQMGATPLAVVQFVDRSSVALPGTGRSGFLVAVYDFSGEGQQFSLWQLGNQALPPALDAARQVLGADSLGSPEKFTLSGMKGYVDSITVTQDGTPYRGYVLGVQKGSTIYEIIIQAPTAEFDQWRSALGQVLLTFRAE
jgi:hypothetical protein